MTDRALQRVDRANRRRRGSCQRFRRSSCAAPAGHAVAPNASEQQGTTHNDDGNAGSGDGNQGRGRQ
eukprot:3675107-Prymnesium_polylepis.4